MQWGKCADTQRVIARSRSAEGRVRQSIINVGKNGEAALGRSPVDPFGEIRSLREGDLLFSSEDDTRFSRQPDPDVR